MNTNHFLKNIPSVNLLIGNLSEIFTEVNPKYLKRIVLLVLESVRNNPNQYNLHKLEKEDFQNLLLKTIIEEVKILKFGSLKPVINATGVVLHTGMGRAPISESITKSMADVGRYSNLEIDLKSGKRGQRNSHLARPPSGTFWCGRWACRQ